MQSLTSSLSKRFNWAILGLVGLLLTSCGTYQNSGYSEDGIYGTPGSEVASNTNDVEPAAEGENAENNYYQQYFSAKSSQLDALGAEADVFTDIESYTTTETIDEEGNIIIEEPSESYGPWGTNPSSVTVNVYDNSWWGPGWGAWGGGWGWNAGWGWGGFGGWGWNAGFGWGNPYWGWGGGWWGGYGFGGFGWGGWGGWGPAWAYGWGWGNPWIMTSGIYAYQPIYGYGRNGVAYNRGRRADYRGRAIGGTNSSANRRAVSSRSNRNSINNRRSSYSRSEVARRINQANARRSSNLNNRSGSNISNSRSSRGNRNVMSGSRRSSNSMRSSGNRSNNSFNNRSRSTNMNRSRGGSMRSSGSRSGGSMRSSGSRGGSMRSSGGGMRSSGGSRGGGGRRGGGRG